MLSKVLTTIFVIASLAWNANLANANLAHAQATKDGLISYWTFNKADIEGDKVKDVFVIQRLSTNGAGSSRFSRTMAASKKDGGSAR